MKKSLKYLIIGIILILALAGCQTENSSDDIVVPEYSSDVIDWSLYSWQEDGEWVFSIIDRYSGFTTFEEVTAEEYRLYGVDTLYEAVTHLPDNSEILWTGYVVPDTVLPPEDLLYEILDYCNAVGVPVMVMN